MRRISWRNLTYANLGRLIVSRVVCLLISIESMIKIWQLHLKKIKVCRVSSSLQCLRLPKKRKKSRVICSINYLQRIFLMKEVSIQRKKIIRRNLNLGLLMLSSKDAKLYTIQQKRACRKMSSLVQERSRPQWRVTF